MGLNLETKDTFHWVDDWGMFRIHPDHTDGLDWKDSIGRNLMAILAYGPDPALCNGLEVCLIWDYDEWKLIRHPDYVSDISKDHWSNFIMYKRWTSDDELYNAFIANVPRITGLYNWMYAIGGSKYDELGYYLLQIPGAYLGNMWNKFMRFWGFLNDTKEYTEGEWHKSGVELQQRQNGWQHLHRQLMIPTYSLENKAWQIRFLRESWAKRWLKRVLLRRLPKPSTNYLLRILLGDTTVTQKQVDTYKHMSGWRWSVFLDQTNDRHSYILSDELIKYNAIESDLLKRVIEVPFLIGNI